MSKKQVVLMSTLVAVPALLLLIVGVFGALESSAKFSGVMWVFVIVTGLLSLVLAASPFALMALYPAAGFAAMGPAAGAAPANTPQRTDSDEDEFEADDDGDGFDDGDEFADAGDDQEELFDDGFDDDAYDDEDLGDFEDDEEEWT